MPHDVDALADLEGFVREDHEAADDILDGRSGRQGQGKAADAEARKQRDDVHPEFLQTFEEHPRARQEAEQARAQPQQTRVYALFRNMRCGDDRLGQRFEQNIGHPGRQHVYSALEDLCRDRQHVPGL